MRVIYCFADDHPDATAALAEHMPDAAVIDVSANSFLYWDSIEARWTGTEDLVIIEHDVVVTAEVPAQLGSCPEPWCSFPCGGGNVWGLRCVKFSAGLQRIVPASDIRSRARRKCQHCGALHFMFIDGPLIEALRDKGFMQPHVHQPELRHCNWQEEK